MTHDPVLWRTPATLPAVARSGPPGGAGRRGLRATLAAVAVFLCASTTFAQIITLEEVEARAQRPRPELLERQARIERARAELRIAQSQSDPQVGARIDGTLAPGGQLVRVTDIRDLEEYWVSGSRTLGQEGALAPSPRYAALLQGRMTLLDFGRTDLGVRAAEAVVDAERASLLQAKVELVRTAREAYLAWIEAHQTWRLSERDAEVARARSVSVRELIGEGVRPATDATLSTYDEQLARLQQTRARRAVERALSALSAAIEDDLPAQSVPDLDVIDATEVAGKGQRAEPPGPAAPSPAAPDPADEPGGGQVSTSSGVHESMLRAVELRQRAAISAARAADRASAPVLGATAEVGVQGQDERIFPVYRAGVSLSIPLWDGGRDASQAAVHRAEASALDARRRSLERTLERQRRDAEKRFATAQDDLRMTLELLATAETLLREAEAHYEAGSDTLERVLEAQRSLVRARREVLTARLETARARLELTPVTILP